MWEPDDLETLLATLRDRVDERRRAGAYPGGLEEELAEHFAQLTVERAPTASALLGQLDAARQELRRVEFTRHVNEESRLPGGKTAHRVVNKAVARQIDDVIEQAQRHAQAVDRAVSILTDVVTALAESYDAVLVQQIGDLQVRLAGERALLHEIALRLDDLSARFDERFGPGLMRLLYVVQRYGETIAGGAEQLCRELAERMARRGHRVEVVTTCAHSYRDWANVYEPGSSVVNDVVVHRLSVTEPRDYPRFDEMNTKMVTGKGARPLLAQREWMRMQGPYTAELPEWLRTNAPRFDCVICVTYLYWTTWAALETVPGIAPVLLHPLVHDEPALRLSIFDGLFRAPDAFAFASPEEVELIRRRFRFDPPGEVIGIGVDLPDELAGLGPDGFRSRYVIGTAPYLLYVGRVQPAKGVGELIDSFVVYKERHPDDDLKLVLLGEPLLPVPARDDIVATGFVDDDGRDAALAGAFAFVQPSFFESFSMVLTEAFAHRRPALVQGRCEPLRGQARRSGAAIPYVGFAEFECALEMLRADAALGGALGAAGRAYVEREYTWDVVLERYERLIDRTVTATRAGLRAPGA